jgi:hypothetical protein
MQPSVAIHIRSPHSLNKLKKTRKRALLIQHLKRDFILPPVEENE